MRKGIDFHPAGAALLGLLAAGCAGDAAMPPETYYRLSAPVVATKLTRPLPGTLVVGRPRADGPLNGRAMVYTRPGRTLRLYADPVRRWMAPPPRLVQRYLVAALRAAGAARQVFAQDARLRPDYRLDGALLAFEHHRPAGMVRVGLDLRLEDVRRGRILFALHRREEAAVAGAGAQAVARAYSRAMDAIVQHLLAELAATDPPGPRD